MTPPTLGRLVDQPLRHAWGHEAARFTPWLADNLDAIGDVVGMPLAFEARPGVVLEPDRSGYHLDRSRAFSPDDRAQWDDGIDWLHAQASAYLDVLRDLSAGPHGRAQHPGTL